MPSRRTMTVVLGLVAMILGCHRGPPTMTLQERLESMKGHSIDEAVMRWGVPNGTHQMTDGTIAHTWRRPWTSSGVNYAVAGGAVESFQHTCTITIQTDVAGIIIRYRYDDC